jgi:hypothetical protein
VSQYLHVGVVGSANNQQSELSTLEMRLNVYPFAIKLARLRPSLVCFVGKKIWDVFETVAGRTAKRVDPIVRKVDVGDEGAEATSTNEDLVKMESRSTGSSSLIDLDPPTMLDESVDVKPVLFPTPTSPLREAQTPTSPIDTPRRRVAATPYNWHLPRTLRLPLDPDEDGTPGGHCYFWVTPSTSGLERTPVSRLGIDSNIG